MSFAGAAAATAAIRTCENWADKTETAPPERRRFGLSEKQGYFLSAASRSLTCSFTFSRTFRGTPA